MKNRLFILSTLFLFLSFVQVTTATETQVKDIAELNKAISSVKAGDVIIMANGIWNDVQIKFIGQGTKENPITLRAETAGEVFIQGTSDLKLGGEYLIVEGLYFTNGASPSGSVIQYFIDEKTIANHCRVTNCVIKDFNKAQRNMTDYWVLFRGRHNQLDHCYLAEKSNKGPTVRVNLSGNQSIKNYHQINNNHFGPRPPKGGPSAETIQIGSSFNSMTPSHTMVENNLFDKCNGEVEIISSKSNHNEFRGNVFYKSQGSLVTRHGNYCIVDGNYFIGDKDSPHEGGVRLIGTGHIVTNNYFYNLKGKEFRAPLAFVNGIYKPTINRYWQVTDAVVAFNTWVNCTSPWQFGVGSNVDQKDILPASEIRSETAIRTILANNVIYNKEGDQMPIIRYDSIDGIEFHSNVINNQGVAFRGVDGMDVSDFTVNKIEKYVWVPATELKDVEVYNGFEFDKIKSDLFGNSRTENNSVGAIVGNDLEQPKIMELTQYGPDWFEAKPAKPEPTTHKAASPEELVASLSKAKDGDIISLTSEKYEIASSLKIDKKITIQSAKEKRKAIIAYTGDAETPLFEMNPKAQLKLKSLVLKGSGENNAFASLKENMSSLYNLKVKDSEIENFNYVLKAYKYSFSEYIKFKDTQIRNCKNGLELSGENDDKGDYNAENISIINCQFEEVKQNVIDYYRGGYDESTVGGNLVVSGCTFTKSGADEKDGTLINTYGIINVAISGNTFEDNPVKRIATLWGAKNNSHSDNVIKNSGEIVVEQNLKLKMMY